MNYAVQKLVSEGKLDVDTKISDFLGAEYLNATIKAPYAAASLKTIRAWKSSVTVHDVMRHRAGYPPEIHYYDKNYDLAAFKHNEKTINPLFTRTTPNSETRAKTYRAILLSHTSRTS